MDVPSSLVSEPLNRLLLLLSLFSVRGRLLIYTQHMHARERTKQDALQLSDGFGHYQCGCRYLGQDAILVSLAW
jgi:hypothetical protein